jgi:hypothetical protein
MKKQIILIMGLMLLSLISLFSALVIDSVSTLPNEVSPGETAKILIVLENDGDNDIEDVSVSLDLTNVPFAPFGSSSEVSINAIDENDDEDVSFRVIVLGDAESGIYKIPVIIKFNEKGDIKIRNSLIGLTVNSKPLIGVDVEDSLLLKGKENIVSIKIINKGLSKIKFLDVEIERLNHFDVLGSSMEYIGDIDSDDFDTVEFKVLFKEKIPSSVDFPVQVNYRDVLNREHKETFNLRLRVYSEEKAVELGLIEKSNTRFYVVAIVFLVIVYFVYGRIRKRMRAKLANNKLVN